MTGIERMTKFSEGGLVMQRRYIKHVGVLSKINTSTIAFDLQSCIEATTHPLLSLFSATLMYESSYTDLISRFGHLRTSANNNPPGSAVSNFELATASSAEVHRYDSSIRLGAPAPGSVNQSSIGLSTRRSDWHTFEEGKILPAKAITRIMGEEGFTTGMFDRTVVRNEVIIRGIFRHGSDVSRDTMRVLKRACLMAADGSGDVKVDAWRLRCIEMLYEKRIDLLSQEDWELVDQADFGDLLRCYK